MLVGKRRDAAAPGRPGQKAKLHQIRLVHILQSHSLFANGGSQGLQAHRAAAVVADDGSEHPAVDVVKTQLVHLQPLEGKVGGLLGDHAVAHDLGKIPHPP